MTTDKTPTKKPPVPLPPDLEEKPPVPLPPDLEKKPPRPRPSLTAAPVITVLADGNVVFHQTIFLDDARALLKRARRLLTRVPIQPTHSPAIFGVDGDD